MGVVANRRVHPWMTSPNTTDKIRNRRCRLSEMDEPPALAPELHDILGMVELDSQHRDELLAASLG